MIITNPTRFRPRTRRRVAVVSVDLGNRKAVTATSALAFVLAFGLAFLLLWLGCLVTGHGHVFPGCVTGATLTAIFCAHLVAQTLHGVLADARRHGAVSATVSVRINWRHPSRWRTTTAELHPFSSLGAHMSLAPISAEWCPADRPYYRTPFDTRPPRSAQYTRCSRGPGR